MQVSAIEAFSPVKIDWRKLTAKEIIQHKEQGEEVPVEYLQWAQQFLSQIGSADDETTYEMAEATKGAASTEQSSGEGKSEKKGFLRNMWQKIGNFVSSDNESQKEKGEEVSEETKAAAATSSLSTAKNNVNNGANENDKQKKENDLVQDTNNNKANNPSIDATSSESSEGNSDEEKSQEAQKTDEEKSKEQAAQAIAAAGGSATALQSAQNIGKSDGDGEIKRLEPPKLGSVNEIEAMEKEMKETNERLKAQQEVAKAAAKAARRQKLKGLNPFANLNNLQSTITALNANVQSQMSGASAIGPMVMGLAKGAAVSAAASLLKAGEDAQKAKQDLQSTAAASSQVPTAQEVEGNTDNSTNDEEAKKAEETKNKEKTKESKRKDKKKAKRDDEARAKQKAEEERKIKEKEDAKTNSGNDANDKQNTDVEEIEKRKIRKGERPDGVET